jgi:glyoxylase-like metal-dependent hydrolase (beta-lactamase superfamily II)
VKIADDGVLQLTLPMPFALREVHVYALETGAGWVLIDSGFASEAARAQLELMRGPSYACRLRMRLSSPINCRFKNLRERNGSVRHE